MKKARARALWNAGFRTPKQIANASPEQLIKATKNLGPFAEGYFHSIKTFHSSFRVARKIIRSAKELLEKKAKELRETAEEMLYLKENLNPTFLLLFLDRKSVV